MKRAIVALASAVFFLAFAVAAGQAAETIKIGSLTDTTGPYATIGVEQHNATEMAIEEINAAGGLLGRKLEMVREDDASNPGKSATKAEKLFLQDKVDFIVGTISSGATLNAMNIAKKYEKVMMVPISMSPKITGDNCNKYTFRVNSNSYFESKTGAQIMKKMGGKVFFLAADYEWGKATTQTFKDEVLASGGTSVGEMYFPLGTKDFAPYFGKVQAAKPDVLLITASSKDAISSITQVQEFGINKRMKLFGPGSFTSGEVLAAVGAKADGIQKVDQWSPTIKTPENVAFIQAYTKRYGREPNKFTTATYESVMWLAQAVKKAGSVEGAKVAAAMEGSTYNGPQGPKTMRKSDHQALMDMYVLDIQGGRDEMVSKVPAAELTIPEECSGM
ncbi:MAG: ABC transporter substrate-binding protein [Candidatus Lambdaproteobacteria bacterium]|nr:ABC transporter substrate-binding protein [Candidatus Lambdaproteobacteria bacterium]